MNNSSDTQDDSSMLPIFVSDGLVNMNKEKVISICEDSPIHQIIKITKRVAADNGGLSRDIWLSVGNFEAALKNNPKFKNVSKEYKWPKIIKEVVDTIFGEVNSFDREVSAAGGKVFLTTLIPRPYLVDEEKSLYSEKVQKLCSRIFIRVNKEIYMFMKKRNRGKISIHSYLEVKRKKSFGKCGKSRRAKIMQHTTNDYYPGRDQRKINCGMFRKDLTRLTKDANDEISDVINKIIEKEQKRKEETCD